MPTSKNIIIGAAETFLGPSTSSVTGADAATRITAWKPGAGGVGTFNETAAGRYSDFMKTAPVTSAGWFGVGYTTEGLTVANDPSWQDVEVDQVLDAPKIFKDKMSFNISTSFAEATLENLLVAWGQSSSYLQGNASATVKEIGLEAGALGQAPLERGLIAIGNAPEKQGTNAYGERTYFVYRVISVESSSNQLARAEATVIPVSFRALPEDNARYGSIRDRSV